MASSERQPDFFLVGAPKCGTTAMHVSLREHPDVFMPAEKEHNHFATDLVPTLLELIGVAADPQIVHHDAGEFVFIGYNEFDVLGLIHLIRSGELWFVGENRDGQ